VGRQYVLENSRLDNATICSRLAYLCETTGMKLRYKNMCARGVMVYARYSSGDYWYDKKFLKRLSFPTPKSAAGHYCCLTAGPG